MQCKCACGAVFESHRKRWRCAPCQAAYMRATRPKYSELTDEQRRKNIVRAYSRVLVVRGKVPVEPCRICGDEKAQRHHPDYSNPRVVEWLCKLCHVEHHMAGAA